MGHLWQRFLLVAALLVGLAVGVGATVFGYSNLQTVNVHWSVFQLDGVPLWAVGIVPVALVLVAGTVYHWIDGLHHFTEHMRHRHRVRELEAEITRLREHLDHVLEMPRGDTKPAQPAIAEAVEVKETDTPSLPAAAEPEPESLTASADEMMDAVESDTAPAPTEKKASSDKKRRSRIIMESEPEPAQANGVDSEPEPAAAAAASAVTTEG